MKFPSKHSYRGAYIVRVANYDFERYQSVASYERYQVMSQIMILRAISMLKKNSHDFFLSIGQLCATLAMTCKRVARD